MKPGSSFGLITFTVLMLLTTATGRAACPVALSLGAINADGGLSATVTTNGNCGASSVSIMVGGAAVDSHFCSGPSCTRTFSDRHGVLGRRSQE